MTLYLVVCKKCHYLSAICDIVATSSSLFDKTENTTCLVLGKSSRASAGNRFEFRYKRCYPDVDQAPTIKIEGKPMNANYKFIKIGQ